MSVRADAGSWSGVADAASTGPVPRCMRGMLRLPGVCAGVCAAAGMRAIAAMQIAMIVFFIVVFLEFVFHRLQRSMCQIVDGRDGKFLLIVAGGRGFFINFAGMKDFEGTVIRSTGSWTDVMPADGGAGVRCRVKGSFRIKGLRTTSPVAVGDGVTYRTGDDGTGVITGVRERRNYIIRRATNLSKESHVLAANVDQALLVATLREPDTTTTFIDRFLATAEAYGVPAVLVLNKADMWDEEDRELGEAMCVMYSQAGYRTVCTSAVSGRGLDELRELTAGRVSLLAGNSGVGKSSLINALIPGLDLRTGDVSAAHHTGMHTTTFSEMLFLPGGGALIDIPGVKGFGTVDFKAEEVSHYFPEIFRAGRDCRFQNCTHTHEPGCAVLRALDEHRIAQSRYASYLSILEDSGDDKYRKAF